LAHIGNRDILLSTVIIVLVGFVNLLSNILLHSRFSGGGDRKNGGLFVIIGIVLAILSPIAAIIIQLAISRKREYLADATGALLTRYPEGLASALEKIKNYEGGMSNPNAATAHLFIANPYGNMINKTRGLFSSHPPIDDRIKILRGEKV
jgi:heat shock protein HtpX